MTNPTLKDIEGHLRNIERHLKKQDKEMARNLYIAMASAGGGVALVGSAIYAQTIDKISACCAGWILIVMGVGFMLYCLAKWQKHKRKVA